MPWHAPGNSIAGGIRQGSTGGPLREHQLQLAEYQIPVLAAGVPVFHDPLRGQIQHPAQGIVIGKRRLVFRDLSELGLGAQPTGPDVRGAGCQLSAGKFPWR